MEILSIAALLIVGITVIAAFVIDGSILAMLTFISAVIAFTAFEERSNELQQTEEYRQYRDHSYHDYSKDKEYRKWLIDNPKEK